MHRQLRFLIVAKSRLRFYHVFVSKQKVFLLPRSIFYLTAVDFFSKNIQTFLKKMPTSGAPIYFAFALGRVFSLSSGAGGSFYLRNNALNTHRIDGDSFPGPPGTDRDHPLSGHSGVKIW